MTLPIRRPVLNPYDTGEVLEPKVWSLDDYTRFGKVDFDDESATQITVRAKPTQRGVRVEISSHFDGIVQVVVDGRVIDVHTA